MKRWHLLCAMILSGLTGMSYVNAWHTDSPLWWALAGFGTASVVAVAAIAPELRGGNRAGR